jgi:hypothetical protein
MQLPVQQHSLGEWVACNGKVTQVSGLTIEKDLLRSIELDQTEECWGSVSSEGVKLQQ